MRVDQDGTRRHHRVVDALDECLYHVGNKGFSVDSKGRDSGAESTGFGNIVVSDDHRFLRNFNAYILQGVADVPGYEVVTANKALRTFA